MASPVQAAQIESGITDHYKHKFLIVTDASDSRIKLPTELLPVWKCSFRMWEYFMPISAHDKGEQSQICGLFFSIYENANSIWGDS